MKLKLLTLTAFFVVSASTAYATRMEVYSNNFNASNAVHTGAGVRGAVTGTRSFADASSLMGLNDGFMGRYLRNMSPGGGRSGATVFTITDLPKHVRLDVDFIALFIDSWDGRANGDVFKVVIDGTEYLNISCDNQSKIGCELGMRHLDASLNVGTSNANWGDSYIDLEGAKALNIHHTSSTAVIEIFTSSGSGWTGGNDESFGIENFRVAVDVPLPSTLLLLGAGLLGLGALSPIRKVKSIKKK